MNILLTSGISFYTVFYLMRESKIRQHDKKNRKIDIGVVVKPFNYRKIRYFIFFQIRMTNINNSNG